MDQIIQLGSSLSIELEAIEGTAPYEFSVDGLPQGLQIEGDSIYGIPEQVGNYPIIVAALDSRGKIATSEFTLVVQDVPLPAVMQPVVEVSSPTTAIHPYQAKLLPPDPFATPQPDPVVAVHSYQAIVSQLQIIVIYTILANDGLSILASDGKPLLYN